VNTLILYCSKYGATEKCVNLINDRLKKKADMVNLTSANSSINIDGYDTLLIGGGIYAGKIQSELAKFINANKDSLKNKNTGIFICCKDKNKAMEYIKSNFPKWLTDNSFILIHLGHEINMDKMSPMVRFLFKYLFKIKNSYSEIDYDSIDKIANKVNKVGESYES